MKDDEEDEEGSEKEDEIIQDDEDQDEIRPLGEDKKRKFGKSIPPKRPSFQKQTSRYEDRLRNEDLAVQAAYEKRKESKKLSTAKRDLATNIDFQPTQEESYDFFTRQVI